MKLVVDKNIPYLNGVLEPFFSEVLYLSGSHITPEVVRNADALLIRTRTFCNEKLLKGSKVKFIGSATIGYDHIDTNYCDKNGIIWATAPGCNSGGVLQWVVCVLLHISQSKNIPLVGKTLGVVGVGNVGSKIVKAGEALGMKVLCCDPPRKRNENLTDFVDFQTITNNADIITFHVPLNRCGVDATLHLANDPFFNEVKRNAIILNSSRGEVVDTSYLVNAIKSGKVAASALDVWEGEPSVSPEIVSCVDIATPHIAGYSLEGKVNGTRMVVDALSNYFNLGIEPWNPTPNPVEEKVLIKSPKNYTSIIANTYNIAGDDKAFRSSLGDFEKLRNEYKYRREFSAHMVETADKDLVEVLTKLGFGVSNQ